MDRQVDDMVTKHVETAQTIIDGKGEIQFSISDPAGFFRAKRAQIIFSEKTVQLAALCHFL